MPASERLPSYDDLVQLPRFDATSAVTLGERLVVVADAESDLPRAVRRAKEALADDLASLRLAVAARLAAASGADAAAVATADRLLDGCWTALYDWLTGFSKLPDGTPEAAVASTLLQDIYPDGLSFILLPYEMEWNQSDLRLGRISTEPLGDRIRSLGGQIFIDALTGAHTGYGKLLGLPRPPGERPAGATTVAEALDAFATTLRIYALKVTAIVEVDEPDTAALSARLLSPLLHYRANPRFDAETTLS